jgi:hypothetical protein
MNKNQAIQKNRKNYIPPKLEKVSLAVDESVLQISKCKTTGMAFGPDGYGCTADGVSCKYVNS